MRILLVHNCYQQPGGEDIVVEQERRLLQQQGHEVSTYFRSNWDTERFRGIEQLELARRTVWASDSKRDITKLLRTNKPDVVHVHNTFVMISPSIYSACAEAGVPVVQTLHNYRLLCPSATFYRDRRICEECVDHSLWQSVRYRCYQQSAMATGTIALMLAVHRRLGTWQTGVACYICVSHFSRSRFVRAGFPEEKIVVKPNFVDPDPGRGKSDGAYAVFAGRLAPAERVKVLLDAWSLIGNGIPLVIIGGGKERAQLEQEAIRRGLNVRFRGHLPHEQVLSEISAARFLVFSSEWYENFPVTIVESFACGVPVICSRVGAMQELVEDGRTGLHFMPGSSEDLAEKVRWALNNRDRMQAMADEARHEYETKYSAATNYQTLMTIYEQAVARA